MKEIARERAHENRITQREFSLSARRAVLIVVRSRRSRPPYMNH